MPTIHFQMGTFLILTSLLLPTVWAEETPAPVPANPPPPAATAPATPTPPAATAPQVARSAFTTSINAREPVDQLARISAGQQVYYFTELVGLQGHVVTHRWEKDGAFQLGLQFPVGAERWRVHSNKNIATDLPGTWTVTVQNDDGSILKQDTLVVDPVMPATPATPPAASPAPAQPAPAQPPANSPTPEAGQEAAPPATPTPTAPASPADNNTQPIWEKLPK